MNYPDIFNQFTRTEVLTDGESVYDFLGGGIKASYKHGWEKNVLPAGKAYSPGYPGLSEWTVDWVASTLAALLGKDNFKVVELGAGYGQWMVTAIMAYKSLHPSGRAIGMALEADSVHFGWLESHVERNLAQYDDVETLLLQAAAGRDGTVEFPVIVDPAKNYGASYAVTHPSAELVAVDCLSLASIYSQLPDKRVDLLHIDIQGAEEDLIRHPEFTSQLQSTSVVQFGTHRTEQLHQEVRGCLVDAGFEIVVDWPRDGDITTAFGNLKTNDGAILAVHADLLPAALAAFDFSTMENRVV